MGNINTFKSTFLIGVYLVITSLLSSSANAFSSGNPSQVASKAKREAMLRDYLIKHPKPVGEIAGIGLCQQDGFLGARGAAFCCSNPASYWCRVGASWLNTMDWQNGGSKVGPAPGNNNLQQRGNSFPDNQ
jgi:hypothetical protein